LGDVESAIGMKVDTALPSSRVVPLTMNRGSVLVLEERDSAVAQQLLSFAGRFLPGVQQSGAPATERKSRFSLRRR
jgi:hypothetical protein